MDLTVTIPAGDVAGLQEFMEKRLLILYPNWDTTGMDVIQIMLDDFAQNRCCESKVSNARWELYEAAPENVAAAQQAVNDAMDAKLAMEAARLASRS